MAAGWAAADSVAGRVRSAAVSDHSLLRPLPTAAGEREEEVRGR
jgi:hypothetical protein